MKINYCSQSHKTFLKVDLMNRTDMNGGRVVRKKENSRNYGKILENRNLKNRTLRPNYWLLLWSVATLAPFCSDSGGVGKLKT